MQLLTLLIPNRLLIGLLFTIVTETSWITRNILMKNKMGFRIVLITQKCRHQEQISYNKNKLSETLRSMRVLEYQSYLIKVTQARNSLLLNFPYLLCYSLHSSLRDWCYCSRKSMIHKWFILIISSFHLDPYTYSKK